MSISLKCFIPNGYCVSAKKNPEEARTEELELFTKYYQEGKSKKEKTDESYKEIPKFYFKVCTSKHISEIIDLDHNCKKILISCSLHLTFTLLLSNICNIHSYCQLGICIYKVHVIVCRDRRTNMQWCNSTGLAVLKQFTKSGWVEDVNLVHPEMSVHVV